MELSKRDDDGNKEKRSCPIFDGSTGGLELLLYVEEEFEECSDDLEITAGPDKFKFFRKVLAGNGLDKYYSRQQISHALLLLGKWPSVRESAVTAVEDGVNGVLLGVWLVRVCLFGLFFLLVRVCSFGLFFVFGPFFVFLQIGEMDRPIITTTYFFLLTV